MVHLHETRARYLWELWERWRSQRAALAGDVGSRSGHSGREGTGWSHTRREQSRLRPRAGCGPPCYSPAPWTDRCCNLDVGCAAKQLTNNKLAALDTTHLQGAWRMAKRSLKAVCNGVKKMLISLPAERGRNLFGRVAGKCDLEYKYKTRQKLIIWMKLSHLLI